MMNLSRYYKISIFDVFFLTVFDAASQGILAKVGQEATLENVKKDAQSKVLEYRDRFIPLGPWL